MGVNKSIPRTAFIKKVKQRHLPKRDTSNGNSMIIPSYSDHDSTKIAIIQPACYGDNINSTLMLKPLKQQYPNCIIDVFTADIYATAFANNPYIHKLIEFKVPNKEQALHLLHVIPPLLNGRGYDMTFCPHPMINGDKWTSIKHGSLGTNLINAWVRALEEAGVNYQLPLETILNLTSEEVANVDAFCSKVNMVGRNIIMETEGLSGQTFWTPEWTMRVCKHLLRGDTNLFVSRRATDKDVHELQQFAPGRVHFAGQLSIRECAELFNRCDVFFSVSSGLSNACGTSWCKKDKKWIETINSDAVSSGPIRREGKIFWTDCNLNNFIRMLNEQVI